MKKRILAMALFAVMVLSLIPIAQAAPVYGQPTRLELINQSSVGSSGKITGNVVIDYPTQDWSTLKITADYRDLVKSSQTYYEDNIAKFNVFTTIFLTQLASGTSIPANPTQADLQNLAKQHTNIQLDSFRSNGNLLSMNRSVQRDGQSVPTVYLFTNSESNGATNLFVRVCLGEFTTSGESKSVNYTLSWPSGSGTASTSMRAEYTNTGGSDKSAKPLYVKPSHTGDDGLYNVYVTNGVVFIDYARDIDYNRSNTPAIPMKFTFYEDAAATIRVPASGQRAYVRATDTKQTNSGSYASDRFFIEGSVNASVYYLDYGSAANSGRTIQQTDGAAVYNDEATVLGVWLPRERDTNTNRTMRIRLEGRDYAYQTSDIKVVFRPLPRNQITTAVTVERHIKLAVGESKRLTIESASATTYSNIRLQEVASTRSKLYIDGLTITGLNIGTAQLQVTASGRVIDQITVEVVATSATPTPTPTTDRQWRVLARRLNVRTGPGTGYPVVGTALMNQLLTGTDQGNGWVRLADGRYVSKSYLVPVNAYNTLGTYAVTASALNVRTGPGSSYGKARSALPKGTVVTVSEIAYGWANIGSGWVSMNYLR